MYLYLYVYIYQTYLATNLEANVFSHVAKKGN